LKEPVVIVGVGEIGTVFGAGFLRLGRPVFPVILGMNPVEVAERIGPVALALVAVREDDLHAVLDNLPPAWRDRIGLVQNELMPADWMRHGIENPTVAAVWFEKRSGKLPAPYFPSPVFGPGSELMIDALRANGLEAYGLSSPDELLYELVRKNLYIISKNIAGLAAPGSVGELWQSHRQVFLQVAEDVYQIQEARAGVRLPRERLFQQFQSDVEALPDKGTAGGSARGRLARTLAQADAARLPVPALRAVQVSLDVPEASR
jgi:hypothetical protein